MGKLYTIIDKRNINKVMLQPLNSNSIYGLLVHECSSKYLCLSLRLLLTEVIQTEPCIFYLQKSYSRAPKLIHQKKMENICTKRLVHIHQKKRLFYSVANKLSDSCYELCSVWPFCFGCSQFIILYGLRIDFSIIFWSRVDEWIKETDGEKAEYCGETCQFKCSSTVLFWES